MEGGLTLQDMGISSVGSITVALHLTTSFGSAGSYGSWWDDQNSNREHFPWTGDSGRAIFSTIFRTSRTTGNSTSAFENTSRNDGMFRIPADLDREWIAYEMVVNFGTGRYQTYMQGQLGYEDNGGNPVSLTSTAFGLFTSIRAPFRISECIVMSDDLGADQLVPIRSTRGI